MESPVSGLQSMQADEPLLFEASPLWQICFVKILHIEYLCKICNKSFFQNIHLQSPYGLPPQCFPPSGNMQEQADTIQNNVGSIVGVDDKSTKSKSEPKETAVISVCAGDGLKDAFLELHCDYVVSGGQTMNPSTEDMVQAVKDVNAKNVIILPNNSNIIMTAQQTATILEDEVNVIVIPTKTIPQGLSACIMFNPDATLDDNVVEMNEAVGNVKTGQVTFAIKDTNIDGVEIKANDYMALVEKNIVACVSNKLSALKVVLENLIDEDAELVTLIYGEDVNDEDVEEIESFVEDNFDVELEIVNGKQPVYSFIVGVE